MQSQPEFTIVTGFGDKGIAELSASLQRAFPKVSCPMIISGCPLEKAEEEPDILIDDVRLALRERTREVVLMGHSYGALLALSAACREGLQDISKLILIDGPLHPRIEVKPVNSFLRQFIRQYRERVRIASECLEILPSMARKRIVTLGTKHDRIVPGKAKSLYDMHDDICHIELPDTNQDHDLVPNIAAITHHIVALLAAISSQRSLQKI